MVEFVKFGQSFNDPPKNQKGMILYPPKVNCKIAVRFVGSQQKIYSEWNNMSKKFSFYKNKEENAVLRIASFVIDREDDKIKAFLCPVSVFRQLGEYGSNHDFSICREGQGLKTKYIVDSLGESEVSPEIEKRVEATSSVYSLVDIFVNCLKWEIRDEKEESITNRFEIMDF